MSFDGGKPSQLLPGVLSTSPSISSENGSFRTAIHRNIASLDDPENIMREGRAQRKLVNKERAKSAAGWTTLDDVPRRNPSRTEASPALSPAQDFSSLNRILEAIHNQVISMRDELALFNSRLSAVEERRSRHSSRRSGVVSRQSSVQEPHSIRHDAPNRRDPLNTAQSLDGALARTRLDRLRQAGLPASSHHPPRSSYASPPRSLAPRPPPISWSTKSAFRPTDSLPTRQGRPQEVTLLQHASGPYVNRPSAASAAATPPVSSPTPRPVESTPLLVTEHSLPVTDNNNVPTPVVTT